MTTLFLVRDFPPDIGGVQTVLGSLAEQWPGRVRVIALECDGAQKHDARFIHPIRRIPSFRRYPPVLSKALRQVWFFFAVLGVWRETRFDRIVCGYLAANAPVAFIWKRLFRVPYVVMTYGMELLRVRRSRARSFWRAILENAELVVTIADIFSDFISEFAPRSKIRKIPLGCGNPTPAEASRLKTFRGVALHSGKILLSVGRLVPRKGIDTVLEALRRLDRSRSDFVYIIAGDGPDKPRLQALAAQAGVADRVVFAGRVGHEELAALYNRADLFLMPSRNVGDDVEGFGIVFIEAGSYGIPVIGGLSGGVAEAVRDGKNGFLVDPLDPDELAAKIEMILGDPELARGLGNEGRRLASEIHTFANMYRALADALKIQ
jgi:phosphatidyl-myo-inositol dimannoside synthase